MDADDGGKGAPREIVKRPRYYCYYCYFVSSPHAITTRRHRNGRRGEKKITRDRRARASYRVHGRKTVFFRRLPSLWSGGATKGFFSPSPGRGYTLHNYTNVDWRSFDIWLLRKYNFQVNLPPPGRASGSVHYSSTDVQSRRDWKRVFFFFLPPPAGLRVRL